MQRMTVVLGKGRGHRNLEVTGMFYDGRGATACDNYPHRYAVRDDGRGNFASVEESICVNFSGYFFTKEKLDMGNNGWLPIRDWWHPC